MGGGSPGTRDGPDPGGGGGGGGGGMAAGFRGEFPADSAAANGDALRAAGTERWAPPFNSYASAGAVARAWAAATTSASRR